MYNNELAKIPDWLVGIDLCLLCAHIRISYLFFFNCQIKYVIKYVKYANKYSNHVLHFRVGSAIPEGSEKESHETATVTEEDEDNTYTKGTFVYNAITG